MLCMCICALLPYSTGTNDKCIYVCMHAPGIHQASIQLTFVFDNVVHCFSGVEVEDMDNPHAGHGGHGHGGHGGMDPNMLFHMFMQQQQSRGGGRGGGFGF